ncbi:MAG: hypothetical protein WCL60_13580, partial [Methylococcales bacterium]
FSYLILHVVATPRNREEPQLSEPLRDLGITQPSYLGKEHTIQGKKQQYIEYINVFSKTLMFQEKKPVYWANTLIYLAKQMLFLA